MVEGEKKKETKKENTVIIPRERLDAFITFTKRSLNQESTTDRDNSELNTLTSTKKRGCHWLINDGHHR